MSVRLHLPLALSGLLGVVAPPVDAAIDPARAQVLFKEAAQLCGRDGGALWHHSLCGRILLVDWTDNTAVANLVDPGGVLKASGPVFAGTLPSDVIIANTPIEWSGLRWTEMIWPLPDDVAHRHVMIAHELFHRAQNELGMLQRDGGKKLSADWGVLAVEQGALLDKAMTVAAVTVAGGSPDHLQGPGWRLTLNQGWIVAPGERAGDFVVKSEGATP